MKNTESLTSYGYLQEHMSSLTTRMQHRPAMYTLPYNYAKPLSVNNSLVFTIIRRYQQLVYIALTTLQIRRLLWDDVESANVCIVRCSIDSCAPDCFCVPFFEGRAVNAKINWEKLHIRERGGRWRPAHGCYSRFHCIMLPCIIILPYYNFITRIITTIILIERFFGTMH